MSGLYITSFSLKERRIEPTEKASFALQVKNTFEELSVTNVSISATFSPPGNISISGVSGDSLSHVIPPYGDGKYIVEIQTANTPPGEYQMEILFSYDVVIPSSVPKTSRVSQTITVVPD